MELLVQTLKALWAMHPQRFWLIWMTTTTASLVYLRSMIGPVAIPKSQRTARPSLDAVLMRQQIWNPRNVVMLMLLTVFLVSYIAMILVWEDFAYHDDDLFMLYTLRGHNYPLPIWQNNGRFFPFGMQEFNLIRHFTNTAIGYHLFPIIQVLICFCILCMLDAELNITARAGLAVLAMLTPSVLLSFSGLIFEERNVMFLLAGLLLSIEQFEKTKTIAWAIAAVSCAQIMLYFKETGFLLLFGLAAGRLMLRCKNGEKGRWDYERLWSQESRLDLCLASLAVLFLLSYFAVMGIHGNMNYAINARLPIAQVLRDYLWLDVLIWLLVAVLLGRMYLILRGRTAPWPLWDGLALGGVSWFFAYLYLGMFTSYYLAPADLIAVLYVGRIVLLSWKNMQSWSKVAAVILACAVVFQDISLSAFATFEHKNDIHARVAIASALARRYRNSTESIPNLFFPFASLYSIMEFVVYLNYRGIPIDSVKSVRTATAKDDRCIEYRSIRCRPANEPASGDLVVVLPDDQASLADALIYRQRGKSLLSYEPRPSIPLWLYSIVGRFPLASGEYNETRPDRWMDASVTVWK